MPLIPAPPAAPNKDTVPLRLERTLHTELREYAEFLGSSKEYIVSGALRRVFRHDKDFLAWQQARHMAGTSPTPAALARADVPADVNPDATRDASANGARRPASKDRA